MTLRPFVPTLLWLALLACPLAGPAAAQAGGAPPRSVRVALEILDQQRARAPVAAYELLERSGHPAALAGLRAEAADPLRPLLMRARCVRHLAGFAGDPELAPETLRALAELALDAPEQGLRLLATDELAEVGADAARHLELVADHGDDPQVRARALAHHARLAPDEDWYMALLTGEGRELRWDLLDRDLEPVGVELRRAAFEAVVDELDSERLTELAVSRDMQVRIEALTRLVERSDPDAPALTLERHRSKTVPLAERLAAGALHVRYAEDEFVEQLIDAASAEGVPTPTRERVGRTVGPHLTIRGTTDVQRRVARGSAGERAVAAFALRGDRSTRFRKNLERLLEDEDPDLRRLAIEELANWVGEPDVLAALTGRLDDDELPLGDGAAVLRSADVVAGDAAEWPATLRGMLAHPRAEVRAEALALLAERAEDPEAVRALAAEALASDDWPRVAAAIELLVGQRSPAAIEALIEALDGLEGRDLRAVSDGLWRLTGLQLGTRAAAWRTWWADAAEGFEPLDATETELLLEERRLEEQGGTSATFFGVRVDSRRVCFLVDVSGSMKELTSWARTDRDDGGVPRDTRFDVARAELAAALDALPDGTLFNVIVFSDEADAWSRELEVADDSTRRRALAFVDRQAADGGTNLYAALRMAFADQALDALVLLSDGEPSMGELRDPDSILNAIERWNAGRGVRIDCVAIGVQLDLLEELAERCGGVCLSLR